MKPNSSSHQTRKQRSWVRTLLLSAFALGTVLSTTSCLRRPIGREQPRTTNVLVDTLVQSAVDKIDLLFVVDNSLSMADKQVILAEALPDLVDRLVSPICVDSMGNQVAHPGSADENCPANSAREFNPIDNIHIGVVTSSLGGYGAEADCVDSGAEAQEQTVDMAHLLGSLPRGGQAAPSSAATGFLRWTSMSQRDPFVTEFGALVQEAGEFGCGWEATLEAWYRFLVDPYPYTKIVRQPCNSSDTDNLCAGPEVDGVGNQLVDNTILQQRAAFLRPDSLVAIIMLSDENDCSFKASGQTWRLSQTTYDQGRFNAAFKGTAACNDLANFGPDSECCHSCGQSAPPPGNCPSAMNEKGEVVGVGCEEDRKYSLTEEPLLDHPNLRCFQQKRRFGVDYLYPVERYSNALKLSRLCPFTDELEPENDECPGGQAPVPNPLYDDLTYNPDDPEDVRAVPRPQSLVFLGGIVGVPWQDIAVSPNPNDELEYRVNNPLADEAERINWNWIIGDRTAVVPTPEDPLMVESVEPRSGTNPATNEPIAPPGSGRLANPINGHEWNIVDHSDLQYACIFELNPSQPCITEDDYEQQRDMGLAVKNCDCTTFGADAYENPLCQAQGGAYGLEQFYAKAYPSVRQLQVLYDYGENSIVASICPKTTDRGAPDYGYRPAVAAIVDRLKEQLADKCLQRELSIRSNAEGNPEAACIIVEARRPEGNDNGGCDGQAREPIDNAIAEVVRRELKDGEACRDDADCNAFALCEITQLTQSVSESDYQNCLNDEIASGNGWCYVDPAKNIGSEALVEGCPETAKRKLRFVGAGQPDTGTITLVACAGAAFNEEETAMSGM